MDIQEVVAGRRAMREYTQPFRSHKALGAKNGNVVATAVFVCPWAQVSVQALRTIAELVIGATRYVWTPSDD